MSVHRTVACKGFRAFNRVGAYRAGTQAWSLFWGSLVGTLSVPAQRSRACGRPVTDHRLKSTEHGVLGLASARPLRYNRSFDTDAQGRPHLRCSYSSGAGQLQRCAAWPAETDVLNVAPSAFSVLRGLFHFSGALSPSRGLCLAQVQEKRRTQARDQAARIDRGAMLAPCLGSAGKWAAGVARARL